jgi:hypothetical protein
MLKVLSRMRRGARPVPLDHCLLDATFVSLDTAVPRPPSGDGAAAAEHLPVAKLTSDYVQSLCRIRSMSAGGLVADTSVPVPVGAQVRVELSSIQQIRGRVVWVRGETLGIKFDEDADLGALLSRNKVRSGCLPRPPRLDISCGATIRTGRQAFVVEVRDISLGGLKVALSDPALVGKDVHVTIDSLRPQKGKIAWCREGRAGIVFAEPLHFEELADWLGKRVELASLKAGAWTGPRH